MDKDAKIPWPKNIRNTTRKPKFFRFGSDLFIEFEQLNKVDPSGMLYALTKMVRLSVVDVEEIKRQYPHLNFKDSDFPLIQQPEPAILVIERFIRQMHPFSTPPPSWNFIQNGQVVGQLCQVLPVTHCDDHPAICKWCHREFSLWIELLSEGVCVNPEFKPKNERIFCGDICRRLYKLNHKNELRKPRRRKEKPVVTCTCCGLVEVTITRTGARPLCKTCKAREDKRKQRARHADEKDHLGTV